MSSKPTRLRGNVIEGDRLRGWRLLRPQGARKPPGGKPKPAPKD